MLKTLGVVLGAGLGGVAAVLSSGCSGATYGCVAVIPPVFLSEAEARAVVIDEAKKAGLGFEEGGPVIPGVTMEVYKGEKMTGEEKVKADGYDAEHQVSFVVVTKTDVERWTPGNDATYWSADRICAETIADQVKKTRKSRPLVGTFYDPAMPGRSSDRDRVKKRDEKELRTQVRDFVKWLKAQGVI